MLIIQIIIVSQIWISKFDQARGIYSIEFKMRIKQDRLYLKVDQEKATKFSPPSPKKIEE